MARRCQLIAAIESNHGGNWALAADMIKAAADSGADFVKFQLYDASRLRDDDPQKAWLAQSQLGRDELEILSRVAETCSVKLTASVFGIPEAQMAKDCGLTAIKIGSGDVHRSELSSWCREHFHTTLLSLGLAHDMRGHLPMRVIPFYGVSQYPTPYMRGLARLTQTNKSGVWGWSDHGENVEVAKEAILHGATYVERHFTLRRAGARQSAWDSYDLSELRKHAEECAWEDTPEHQAACDKYLNRWSGQ